jgi:adenylate cyclase
VKKIPLIYAIPAGVAAFVALMVLFGWTDALEHRVYDGFLGLRADPPENKSLVLVEVDDRAVSEVGTWPISRSITADALLLLKEMGARYAVFDIEYVNKSPRGVNASVLEQDVPDQLSEDFGTLSANNADLIQALKSRRISMGDAGSFSQEFAKTADAKRQELVDSIKRIAIDNDQRLAQTVKIFGGVVLTVHMLETPDPTVPASDLKTAIGKFALPNVKGLNNIKNLSGVSPTIDPMLSQALALGFTNVFIDPDGVRRRVEVVSRYGEAAFPQLGFTSFWDLAGRPAITVTAGSIELKGAKYPDGKTYDVTIPRAQDGSVLINWPHVTYDKSFRHLSFYVLYQHDKLFNDLLTNLKARANWGYLDPYQGPSPLMEQASTIVKLRQALLDDEAPASAIADLRAARDSFLKEFGGYLASKPDENLLGQLHDVLGQKGLTAEQRQEYEKIQKDLPDWFTKTRNIYDNLMQFRTEADKLGNLADAICFLGNTNTGSTDLGQTPFQKSYPNLGTHASVVNMMLQRQFLTDESPWWSWLLGLAGAFGLTVLLRDRKPGFSISVGAGVAVAVVLVYAILFILTGIYLPVIPMATTIILTFLGTTFYQFLSTEREKGFLRSAFSRYLSNDVIEQIIANPGQLRLGGQEKRLTAMFTDIKGFSTISETMTPEELVFLLNQYLTGMSDIILDLQGTIDKYEGDAIIAFFGAPVSYDDHARRAVLAAVRMKRLEAELNERFMQEKIAPAPLATRIGVNTGLMVVGNMGTDRMMNYTMIGDSVNLAARLEGVNKLYSTWILISEDTKNDAGDAVVTRKLDRVRVVGKSVPIRLYQVVEEKGHVPKETQDLLDAYESALEHFEERRWVQARKGFDVCLKLFPDDGPSARYRKLAAEYEKTPPPENWDGVFKMETK